MGGGTRIEKSDIEKLQVLLPHWVEPNFWHGREFSKWEERAKGHTAVHDEILQAIGQMDSANECVHRALKNLGENSV